MKLGDILKPFASNPPPTAAAGAPQPLIIGERQVALSDLRADLLESPPVRREQLSVERERAYWEIRGWRELGGEYRGSYTVGGATYPGRAETKRDGSFEFFIESPPAALQTHPCVHRRSGNWFYVHIHRPRPRSLAGGITTIENLIATHAPSPSIGARHAFTREALSRERPFVAG